MSNLNLLPWREQKRKDTVNQFKAQSIFAVILYLVALAGGFLFLQAKTDNQIARNNFLDKEIRKLESKISAIRDIEQKRAKLEKRLEVINELQIKRFLPTKLLNSWTVLAPSRIYFDNVSYFEEQVSVEGKTEQRGPHTFFMQNLEETKWIKSIKPVQLVEIENLPAGYNLEMFKLNYMVNLKKLGEMREQEFQQ
jgi:type IV pilus assembly protein PilN